MNLMYYILLFFIIFIIMDWDKINWIDWENTEKIDLEKNQLTSETQSELTKNLHWIEQLSFMQEFKDWFEETQQWPHTIALNDLLHSDEKRLNELFTIIEKLWFSEFKDKWTDSTKFNTRYEIVGALSKEYWRDMYSDEEFSNLLQEFFHKNPL